METLAILAMVGLGLLAELYGLRSLSGARRVRAMIRPHVKLLLLRKRRLARADEDGVEQALWDAERRSLYEVFVPRRLRAFVRPTTFGLLLDAEFACVTNQEIEQWTRIDRASTDWSSFEAEVTADLEACGWRIVRVGEAHYRGADLYAYRSGTIAALQCRFSDAPVGARPVQEASLVREHLNAHIVCAVSNNEYTPTARRMADQTGVMLIHSSELAGVGAPSGHDVPSAAFSPSPEPFRLAA
jgi:Restriction endonuclease